MKKIVLVLTFALVNLLTQAQFPGGGQTANAAGRQAAPAIGHVYGKVVDNSGKAVSDASIILLQSKMDTATKKKKEVLLKGTATKNNGEFSLEELPVMGSLKIQISAVGFSPLEQTISFMPATASAANSKPIAGAPFAGRMPNFEKDLGSIKLSPDAAQLQGVTVTATKPLMRLDIDKKVFNVEKNIVSAGGTALDVMKNVPSVNVDIDGNILLRNTAPQLFVDGRPTTLTLEQIPADAIESVEVITNPSAKYDASGGGAGILNIVLKKNRKTGYNGNVRAGVDKRGALNGGGDFSVRQDKLNISASVMGNQNKGRTSGTTDRLNLLDVPQTSIFQNNYSRTVGGFLFGKVGLDYFLTNRTTLSLSGIRVHGEFNPNEVIGITTDTIFSTGKPSQFSQRTSSGTREFDGQGLVFGMKHLFAKEGEELTTDVNYFSGRNSNNSLYTTNYYGNNSSATGNELQKVIGSGNDNNLTIQTDYVRPLSNKTKLEAGVRASVRERVNNNENYIYDDLAAKYNLISSATANYKSHDNVYAAYATVSSSIRDFGYKLGLRAESSNYNGELLNTKKTFSNSYPISLFPSVFLSQKLKSNQELQVSFTRRINRPNFFQLIPFTDYTDKLNITKGNPGLVPEFTQSVEMSYLKTFTGNNTILGSLYYKNTNNLITRYLNKELDPLTGTENLINTYINANSSYSAGAEITSQNYLTKWMDISTNINIYNSKVNTDNITGTSQDAMWSWFGKFNGNFKLPAKFVIQLTATYQSKTNLPVNSNSGGMGGGPGMMQSQSASQGYIKAFWGTDLAIKKSFMKNDAASVTLSISDIFKTRYTSQYSESDYFVQNYTRLRDPQMIKLNLSYRFGKIDALLFKRKANSSINATEGMQ